MQTPHKPHRNSSRNKDLDAVIECTAHAARSRRRPRHATIVTQQRSKSRSNARTSNEGQSQRKRGQTSCASVWLASHSGNTAESAPLHITSTCNACKGKPGKRWSGRQVVQRHTASGQTVGVQLKPRNDTKPRRCGKGRMELINASEHPEAAGPQ